jgi:hypothetical protein
MLIDQKRQKIGPPRCVGDLEQDIHSKRHARADPPELRF